VAGLLYDNIHTKLFTLPDDTLVLPGHDYNGRCMSSIGEEKRLNPRLTKTRQVAAMLSCPYLASRSLCFCALPALAVSRKLQPLTYHTTPLSHCRQEFINLMHNLNLPHPKQIGRALPANMKVCVDCVCMCRELAGCGRFLSCCATGRGMRRLAD
jgi:hypothetical protein